VDLEVGIPNTYNQVSKITLGTSMVVGLERYLLFLDFRFNN
jgi:hypothetical protein